MLSTVSECSALVAVTRNSLASMCFEMSVADIMQSSRLRIDRPAPKRSRLADSEHFVRSRLARFGPVRPGEPESHRHECGMPGRSNPPESCDGYTRVAPPE